ncbi:hypothetical protein QR680_015484 [Steinernema hermaphroditum]|uniref:Cullin N-terminal domain-containing protein n=1 Tax=Steinernema hermaphroditum TaxID=289476 RepID=A0AA39H7U6_9BILA|nr:hypothetical protein QR680_015484 [Steinernema hermaphroditum]
MKIAALILCFCISLVLSATQEFKIVIQHDGPTNAPRQEIPRRELAELKTALREAINSTTVFVNDEPLKVNNTNEIALPFYYIGKYKLPKHDAILNNLVNKFSSELKKLMKSVYGNKITYIDDRKKENFNDEYLYREFHKSVDTARLSAFALVNDLITLLEASITTNSDSALTNFKRFMDFERKWLRCSEQAQAIMSGHNYAVLMFFLNKNNYKYAALRAYLKDIDTILTVNHVTVRAYFMIHYDRKVVHFLYSEEYPAIRQYLKSVESMFANRVVEHGIKKSVEEIIDQSLPLKNTSEYIGKVLSEHYNYTNDCFLTKESISSFTNK